MSEFKTYMTEEVEANPEHGQRGEESAWLPLGEIVAREGKLLLADTDFLPEESEGVLVHLEPGLYVAEARVMDFSGDRRVSRLRLLLKGAKGEAGEQLGETWVDTAGTGVCDPEAYRKVFDELGEDEALERVREVVWEEPGGVMELGPGAELLFVSAGFGDGTYPVTELMEAGKRVGFEVVLIEPGAAYPFDGNEEDESMPAVGEMLKEAGGDNFREMFSKLAETFQGKRTGEKSADRNVLKSAFEEVLGELAGQVGEALTDYRNHMIEVRKRPLQEEMKLVALAKPDWVQEPDAKEMVVAMEKNGFLEVGSWVVEFNPALQSVVYLREQDAVVGTVTLVNGKPVMGWQVWFTDGTVFELSQTEQSKNPFPEWMAKIHSPGLAPGDFDAEFSRLCPTGHRRKLQGEDYPALVEEEFRRTQDWYIERGGLAEAEVRGMVELPEDAEQAAEMVRTLRQEQAELTLFRWLKRQELPFDCDEQTEFIHIVHEGMDAEFLRMEWMSATNNYRTAPEDFEGENVLEIFASKNEAEGKPLTRVSRKSTGLRADFYVPGDLLD